MGKELPVFLLNVIFLESDECQHMMLATEMFPSD